MGQNNTILTQRSKNLTEENLPLRICVVGAGAAGLAVLKIIKDSEQFKSGAWTVDVYEERDDIGGTWLPARPTSDTEPPPTPMYDSIIANLPHPVMCYQDFWFPPGTLLFPPASTVMVYLRDYANEFGLRPHIQVNTSVIETRWTGSTWKVHVQNNDLGAVAKEHVYDRLVVANGHYRVPYYPPIPELDSWRAARRATHAAWYRSPGYVGDTVLVVGGGYSGADIAAEMRGVCKHLIHAAPGSETKSEGNVTVKGRVVRLSEWNDNDEDNSGLNRRKQTAWFEDGSYEEGIDHIWLATGYVLSFPFFSDLSNTSPPPLTDMPPLPAHLHNSGQHLFPLAHSLFPLQQDFPPWAAAFVGIPVKVAPLPLFEAQARALVRVFASPSALDINAATHEILARLAFLREDPAIGDDPARLAHAWHRFRGNEQFDYRDAMHILAGYESDVPAWKVPEWTKVMYANMNMLRRTWKVLVERGEAGEWVKGVGAGPRGNQEWVDVLERLLEKAREMEVSAVASPATPALP